MKPSLDSSSRWELKGIKSELGFFRTLPDVLPSGSVLYLEGTISTDLRSFLEGRATQPQLDIEPEFPKDYHCHIPISVPNMGGLEDLAASMAAPEICMHMHGYNGTEVMFTWYDAFADPLWLSHRIPEPQVELLANQLGAHYDFVAQAR